MNDEPPTRPNAMLLIAAFAAVYFVWGSTYLAIKLALASFPPFLMGGLRFTIAGGLLYGWSRLRGAPQLGWRQWRSAAIVGGLLLLIGNGGVVYAEQTVPTGLAALVIGSIPLFMAMLEWLQPGGKRPSLLMAFSLLLGMAGVIMLIGPRSLFDFAASETSSTGAGAASLDPWGVAALLTSALAWCIGSLYSRVADLPESPIMATGAEMLCGGALLLILSLLRGEVSTFEPQAVTTTAVLSLGYLIVFGSLVAFTAYVWLLRVSTPARVSTYAYVNPIVALFLGWLLNGEPLHAQTLLAASVIITAVALLTMTRAKKAG